MTTALATRDSALATRDRQFMPAMSMADAIERRNSIVQFVKQVMKEGTDYGTIPGTDKPTLLKAGAEKLGTLFGLTPRPTLLERVEDWTGVDHGGEAFFYYMYRCQLLRNDMVIAEADGSANSWERKHRYRWASEAEVPARLDKSKLSRKAGGLAEPVFAIKKRETGGKYGKPPAYWDRFADAMEAGTARKVKRPKRDGGEMDFIEIDETWYRVPNEDAADVVNTLQKMAQKRAFVAATLLAVNASEFFTQDVEDMDMIDAEWTPAPAAARQPETKPADLTDDTFFMQRWEEAVSDKGLDVSIAKGLLGTMVKKRKLDWFKTDLPTRQKLINDLAAATPEQIAQFKAKAAAADKPEVEKPQTASELQPPGTPAPAQLGSKPSRPVLPPVSAELVETWPDFLDAAWETVCETINADTFSKGIDKAVALLARKGKEESISLNWKLQRMHAIRDGAFDWETGMINQVQQALAP